MIKSDLILIDAELEAIMSRQNQGIFLYQDEARTFEIMQLLEDAHKTALDRERAERLKGCKLHLIGE